MSAGAAILRTTREIADRMLRDGTVVGIVGLRALHNRIGPHVFTQGDGLEALVLEPRQPLALFCQTALAATLVGRLGVVARGCDERALVEMAKQAQVDIERFVLVGLACDEALARACNCRLPQPTRIDAGEAVDGVTAEDDSRLRQLRGMDVSERGAFWAREFERCIKCYGCRNACPVCLCDMCVLEEKCWVELGRIPPSLPFHLIRFWHVADRCVLCGACEAVCPVDIPLTMLHAGVHAAMDDLMDYRPGMDVEQLSPLVTTLEEAPLRER